MRSKLFAAAVTVAAVMTATPAFAGDFSIPDGVAQSAKDAKSGVYIVVMRDKPAIAYAGGVSGMKATKPLGAHKLERRNRDVSRYVGYLESRKDQAMRGAGVPVSAKLATYSYAGDGFAATLTGAQAERLRHQPFVALVTKDTTHHVTSAREAGGGTSSSSADFLGLTGHNGPWARGLTGEGVVVGVIDTGIWPEHPSLSPVGFGPYTGAFTGTGCNFGNNGFNPADTAFTCNNKLLAAKSYGTVFHGGIGTGLTTGEYLSARDADGHGTHTTTTAAGDANVPAAIFGINKGIATGIAPRARVSVYKACWSSPAGDGCAGGDLAEAIDAAVADGVDVINYSIGSDTAGFSFDSLEFLFAFDAGIYVSVSAGNAGPAPDTVGSPAVSSWVTTVGASTTDRTFSDTVTLGNGKKFTGASVTAGASQAPLLDAATLGNEQCDPSVPFSAPVTGAIVLCKRGGGLARVDKGRAVATAGGSGMILYNASATQGTVTDNHYLPASHVSYADGLTIKAYIASAGASAKAKISVSAAAPAKDSVMADFSSRGQNLFAEDILKPDVTAPGVNILAGNTPTALASAPGQLFQAISGTSMASPHVAGIYALMKQANPTWTPAEAKSALMTTARQDVKKEDGQTKADPFDMGAGHVDPGGDPNSKGSLFRPGLVYDSNIVDHVVATCDYFPLLAEALFAATCADLASAGYATQAEDLNLASLTDSAVTGADTVTRSVTNVTSGKLNVSAEVKAPKGFKVKVIPASLKLNAGETKPFTVTFTRTTAAFGVWGFGSLTWSGNGYEVRSPISLRAQEFQAPALVSGSGATSSVSFDVGFGYTGSYSASAAGLVTATVEAGHVNDDPTNNFNTAPGDSIGVHVVLVPAGTAVARFATQGAEPGSDLDLYVFDSSFNLVGVSATPSADEVVDLKLPADTLYYVVVHGYTTDATGTDYGLATWLVPTGPGSLAVTAAPASAVSAASGPVTVSWSGLATGSYLGAVVHTGPAGVLDVTTVAVDVP